MPNRKTSKSEYIAVWDAVDGDGNDIRAFLKEHKIRIRIKKSTRMNCKTLMIHGHDLKKAKKLFHTYGKRRLVDCCDLALGREDAQ